MVKLTQSLKKYLDNYHSDIIIPLTFGHTELLTQEIWEEYIDWCQTDEGRARQLRLVLEQRDQNERGFHCPRRFGVEQ